jgi:hypothetical protein
MDSNSYLQAHELRSTATSSLRHSMRATSSVARPAYTCFSAAMICASVCSPLPIPLPLSFV